MPDYEKLLQASMPEALDSPFDTVNFVYQNADQLLQANVSALDDLNYCVFAYFNRDEIFFLNQSGRRIISPYQSPIERRLETTKFGLETAALASNDDRDVIESCPPPSITYVNSYRYIGEYMASRIQVPDPSKQRHSNRYSFCRARNARFRANPQRHSPKPNF